MGIQIKTVVPIVDNSGVVRIRTICVYGGKRIGSASDFAIGSVRSVKTRRKLKVGNLLRFIVVQARNIVFRVVGGSYVRSLSNRGILLKKAEFFALANRINSFFFLELRKYEEFRNTSLTVYVF